MIKRVRLFGPKTRVIFSLPLDQPAGEVSVVGSFNDWTPGAHRLLPRRNGMRSVAKKFGETKFVATSPFESATLFSP